MKTNKIGRRNEYKAIITTEEYQSKQVQSFLDKIYEGNAKGLVTTLIEKKLFSSEDLEQLKSYRNGGERNS